MKNRHYLLTGFCLLLSTQTVFAEKHKMEQHGSHEHGAARLTVATTDDGIEIALESPAANLFGFEKKAGTPEELKVVHDTVEKLAAGASLFSVNEAAACSFGNMVIDSAMTDNHDEEHEEEHSKDHDKDAKSDDHDDHNDEKQDDHDEKHDNEEKYHSDVDVTWTFKCKQPAEIKSVSTKLFSAFPKGFEALAVEWITASSAGKTELKKDDTIALKQ